MTTPLPSRWLRRRQWQPEEARKSKYHMDFRCALQRLVTSEILVVFAIGAVTATNVGLVGDELDPFDPLH